MRFVSPLLAVLGVLAGALFVEVGMRLYLAYEQRARIDDWNRIQSDRARVATGPVTLGEILRVSADPEQIYELMPDLQDVTFHGHPLAINADGLRGKTVSREPEEGVLRIVGIGDSMMFGHGVAERDGFLRRLETLLAEADPPLNAEVVNLAVPGYNTTMEVASLVAKGLAFHPDLVIIHFFGNDLELPNFLTADSRDFLDPTYSVLFQDVIVPLWSRMPGEPLRGGLLETTIDVRKASSSTLDMTPEHYRHMVGVAGHRRAMERLAGLRDEHGFDVLVTTHRGIPDFLAEACAALGLPLLGTKPAIDRYMVEHGIDTYHDSELTISRLDPHPTPIGHELIATAIRDYLLARGR